MLGVGASGLLGAGVDPLGLAGDSDLAGELDRAGASLFRLAGDSDLVGELDRVGASLFGPLLSGADLSWLFPPGSVDAIDIPQPVLAPNPPDNVCVPVRKGSALALPRVVRVLRLARVTVGRCRGFAITQSHLRCN